MLIIRTFYRYGKIWNSWSSGTRMTRILSSAEFKRKLDGSLTHGFHGLTLIYFLNTNFTNFANIFGTRITRMIRLPTDLFSPTDYTDWHRSYSVWVPFKFRGRKNNPQMNTNLAYNKTDYSIKFCCCEIYSNEHGTTTQAISQRLSPWPDGTEMICRYSIGRGT